MQIGKYYKSKKEMAFYDEANPESEKGKKWINNECYFFTLEINHILHNNRKYINAKVLFNGKVKYITVRESQPDYLFEKIS